MDYDHQALQNCLFYESSIQTNCTNTHILIYRCRSLFCVFVCVSYARHFANNNFFPIFFLHLTDRILVGRCAVVHVFFFSCRTIFSHLHINLFICINICMLFDLAHPDPTPKTPKAPTSTHFAGRLALSQPRREKLLSTVTSINQ